MQRINLFAVGAIALVSGAFMFGGHKGPIAPASLYPNPALTPGKYETLSLADLNASYNGQTYSQAHRDVTAATHRKVYDEYQVPAGERNIAHGEVDHLVPLCAGGSNDLSNLWYQHVAPSWEGHPNITLGFHQKDALEAWICRQIKAKKLEPKVAYEKITSDWVNYYLEVFDSAHNVVLSGGAPVPDPDSE